MPPLRSVILSVLALHELTSVQVINKRKESFADRPLVRISSTFFWHLSSDFDLSPIPELAQRAQALHIDQAKLGVKEAIPAVYEPMKVGRQVQK